MSEVARRLKIRSSTLYRKLDEAAADEGERQRRRGELRTNGIMALLVAALLRAMRRAAEPRTVACR